MANVIVSSADPPLQSYKDGRDCNVGHGQTMADRHPCRYVPQGSLLVDFAAPHLDNAQQMNINGCCGSDLERERRS